MFESESTSSSVSTPSCTFNYPHVLAKSPSESYEDTWCIDPRGPRGTLTLSLTPETYQTLGLRITDGLREITRQDVKQKSRAKQMKLLEVDLGLSLKALTHTKEAIRAWDMRRERLMGCANGEGSWDVLFSVSSTVEDAKLQTLPHLRIHTLENLIIPCITASSIYGEHNVGVADEEEDYHEYVSDIFEWVGMVCLGSQRLHANDRVDPYIAVYSPPTPISIQTSQPSSDSLSTSVGTLTHLRWTGLLSPDFVRSVLDVVFEFSSGRMIPASSGNTPFVSVTTNTYSFSPITHCPFSNVYAPRFARSQAVQAATDQSKTASKPGTTQLIPIQNYKPPHKSVQCWTYVLVPPNKPSDDPNNTDAMDIDPPSKTRTKKTAKPPLSAGDGAWIFASHETPL